MHQEFSSRTLVSCERDQLLFYNMHVFTKNTAVYLHQINCVYTLSALKLFRMNGIFAVLVCTKMDVQRSFKMHLNFVARNLQ